MPLPHLRADILLEEQGCQADVLGELSDGINAKDSPVTSLAPCTDEEIAERINASTSSYTTESNEETFKPDTIFESFHHQARIPISDRALLSGFLMLWLKYLCGANTAA